MKIENPEQLLLFHPTVVPTGRADGAVLFIPGKAILVDQMLTVSQVAEMTGYSPRHVRHLAPALGARQLGPRCKLRFPAREIHNFIKLGAR